MIHEKIRKPKTTESPAGKPRAAGDHADGRTRERLQRQRNRRRNKRPSVRTARRARRHAANHPTERATNPPARDRSPPDGRSHDLHNHNGMLLCTTSRGSTTRSNRPSYLQCTKRLLAAIRLTRLLPQRMLHIENNHIGRWPFLMADRELLQSLVRICSL